MTFYAAMWWDTDMYTYGCDICLGIYSERSKADERCLKDAALRGRDLEEYEVKAFQVDIDWND